MAVLLRRLLDRARHSNLRRTFDRRLQISRKNAAGGHRLGIEELEQRVLLSNTIATPSLPAGWSTGANNIPVGNSLEVPLNDSNSNNSALTYHVTSNNPNFSVTLLGGNTFIDIRVEGAATGDMIFELFNDVTPNTAAYMTGLVESGFYNGISFHRVVPGFVAQFGDPTGAGTYNPYSQPDEIASPLIYSGNGQLGMARTSEHDTQSTQMFITAGPQRSALDYKYTLFGQLISGFSVFNTIMAVPVDTNGKPTTAVNVLSATVYHDTVDATVIITAASGTPVGATATISVTTSDGAGGTSPVGTFNVTAEANDGSTADDPPFFLNFPIHYTTPLNTVLHIPMSALDIFGYPDTFQSAIDPGTNDATLSVTNNILTVTPNTGFTGSINIEVFVERTNDSTNINNGPSSRILTVGVGDTALNVTQSTATLPQGSAANIEVLKFTDSNPSAQASNFTADINWDVGLAPTTATVTSLGGGTYAVTGSNVYANAGTYTGVVEVIGVGGTALTSNITVTVTGAAVHVYRLYNPVTKEHLFTTDLNEYNTLPGTQGWSPEGSPFKFYNGPATIGGVADIPLYRVYDITNKQHLLTTDLNEYLTLRKFGSFSDEGIAGYIFPSQVAASESLYRANYPFNADLHLFTVDLNEYNTLAATYGWLKEGIIGYVLS